MTITTIPEIPVLDFTDEELEIGDTTAFVAKMSSFFAKMMQWSIDVHAQSGVVVNLPEEVNAAITEAMSDNATASGQISDMLDRAMPNLVPDHGGFLSTTELMYADRLLSSTSTDQSIEAQFNHDGMSRFLASFNGSSDPVEVGRYHANDPDLTETGAEAQGLMAAMVGATEDYPRYSMPWAIAEVVAGTGTAGAEDDGKYRLLSTSGIATLGDAVTLSFWYQCNSGSASIRGYEGSAFDLLLSDPGTAEGHQVRVDGVVVGNSYQSLTTGQWHHISISYRAGANQALNQDVLGLNASSGSKNWFALIRLSNGIFTARAHTKPIISIQSLDAMNLDGDDVESDNTQIAAIAAQLDENLSQQNALQTQVNALEEEGLAATLTPQQLANLEGAKGIIDWSDITDYSYFQEGDPLLGYCTFEGVTYKLQADAINNDLGEVVGTTARDALDADYGDYCKIVGGNYWWFDSIADAWIDMGATVGVVPSNAQASPDDGGAWAVVASVSGGVSLHSPDGEYEQGVSIVISPVNGLTYKANTDAVKGSAVDLSTLPSVGDGSSGADWILVISLSTSRGSFSEVDASKDLFIVIGETDSALNGAYVPDGLGGMVNLLQTIVPKPTSNKTAGSYTATVADLTSYNRISGDVTLPVVAASDLDKEFLFYNTHTTDIAILTASGASTNGPNIISSGERVTARVVSADGASTEYDIDGDGATVVIPPVYELVMNTTKNGTFAATVALHNGADPEWFFDGISQGTGLAYDSSWSQPDGSGSEIVAAFADETQLQNFTAVAQSITTLEYRGVAQDNLERLYIQVNTTLTSDIGALISDSIIDINANICPVSNFDTSTLINATNLEEVTGSNNALWTGTTAPFANKALLNTVLFESTGITGTIDDVIHASTYVNISATSIDATPVGVYPANENTTLRHLLASATDIDANIEDLHTKFPALERFSATQSTGTVTGSVDNIPEWATGAVPFRGIEVGGLLTVTGDFSTYTGSSTQNLERINVNDSGVVSPDFVNIGSFSPVTPPPLSFDSIGLTGAEVNQALIDLAAGIINGTTLSIAGTNATRIGAANESAGTEALATLQTRFTTVTVS